MKARYKRTTKVQPGRRGRAVKFGLLSMLAGLIRLGSFGRYESWFGYDYALQLVRQDEETELDE